jgi:Tfp pilus assembly protein PilO
MELLNEYSGLFSLLAVVASVIVPFWIYRKQKKEQEKYYFMQKNDQEHFYQKQQNDHLQDLRDEYEAIESTSMFPMSIADREFYGRKRFLEKKLRRK